MTSAERTEIDAVAGECSVALTKVSRFNELDRVRGLEGGADSSEFVGAAGVCQETKMADATEAFWKRVKEKTTDKLVGVEHHHLGFLAGDSPSNGSGRSHSHRRGAGYLRSRRDGCSAPDS